MRRRVLLSLATLFVAAGAAAAHAQSADCEPQAP